MKKLQLILALALTTTTLNTNAALCVTTTEDGKPAFLFKGDKPTKTLSGTVAKLPKCPEQTVEVRKEVIVEVVKTVEKIVTVEVPKYVEVVKEYLTPNPRNQCEEVAAKVCDPSYGGVPLCTTKNLAGFCGFCYVDTGSGNAKPYINGSPYDGKKAINGVNTCPQPVDK